MSMGNTDFILVLSCSNYYVIFHGNDCGPIVAPPCTCMASDACTSHNSHSPLSHLSDLHNDRTSVGNGKLLLSGQDITQKAYLIHSPKYILNKHLADIMRRAI